MTKRENVLLAYQHKETAWIPSAFLDTELCVPSATNERNNSFAGGKDWFGVDWTFVPELHAPMPTVGFRRLSDITNWKEELEFPDLENIDWEGCAARDTARWDPVNKMSSVMLPNGPFERLHSLLGFEDALIALIDEPEATEAFFTAYTDWRCRLIEKIGKYYHPDILNIQDDWGHQRNMLMSPDTWREMIKPHIKRMVKCAHTNGMIYQQHSCGYIEPIIEDLIEIGVDALEPLQACNDCKAIKAKYGKALTLVGGFDNEHILNRDDVPYKDKRAEVLRVLEFMAPGGSYVAGFVSVNLPDFIPLLDTVHEYNAEVYKENGVYYPPTKEVLDAIFAHVMAQDKIDGKPPAAEQPSSNKYTKHQVVTADLFGNPVEVTISVDAAETVFGMAYTVMGNNITASGSIVDGIYTVTEDPSSFAGQMITVVAPNISNDWIINSN